ncbi:hypothetical protein H257_05144 [Aphanomyces astaci]|uniref:Uncharacterized protein n=1 Tax=Aphanomyces astaci TaxID=112090 RepID=W4GS34_APHAT|nr:hypothetical protein H257_05144 [Aphanomyces astaci]ETV82540.1 hypothetical protein H257_05144 [Aphanomyces astaci]|eukprot:XP_009828209.1 hypothetical protein H257_05144 [Aphanomyces astaci]
MDNYVHVDEKWFYLTKVNRRYYVYDDEEVAARTVKSKHFITKVMFLAAVARPRFDPHTRRVFDGKIGVWPFVEVVAAKRTSVNRDKGTLVTVPLSVNAVQDNASPHKCVTTRKLDDHGISDVDRHVNEALLHAAHLEWRHNLIKLLLF